MRADVVEIRDVVGIAVRVSKRIALRPLVQCTALLGENGLLVVLMLILSACGPTTTPTPAATSAPSTAAATEAANTEAAPTPSSY